MLKAINIINALNRIKNKTYKIYFGEDCSERKINDLILLPI